MRTQLPLAALFSFAVAVPSLANTFSWDYQRTAFRSNSSSYPQTAVSMRNNETWPIVYGIDQGVLNAYSLFPVPYAGPVPISGQPTNWHPIGQNLLNTFVSGSDVFLQAASGKSDGFGVAVQTPHISSLYDATVHGAYAGGFSAPAHGTFAIKFDENDAPVIGDDATIPNLPWGQKLFDIAVSSIGDVGAVTQQSGGNGPLSYWQKSPLLGGAWLSEEIGGFSSDTLYCATVDLTFDTASRPHIVGMNDYFSSNNSVIAHRFDIVTGSWKSATLDSSSGGGFRIVDVAAASNDLGVVGAAWVNNGVLKYAFMDTTQTFPQWIVTTVTSATPTGQPLEQSQGVGLAFDAAGLPIISFVEQFNRQIWIAYDPPVPVEGDFNEDGFVDGEDLEQWIAAQSAGNNIEADADGDGDSDGADFLTWQRNLTPSNSTAGSNAVPEPTTLASAILAACLFISRRSAALRMTTNQLTVSADRRVGPN